eukprot:TRINITY_DN4274_c0_g1_i1.p1 TRINITY_DN4274_c0_g1~~TRINITY_DN4274_c0_g1_i1.p1  ORF type:complete len:318 (-),score=33.53 TRINITY_DN4274_c0_g1_i1:69-1022(-)
MRLVLFSTLLFSLVAAQGGGNCDADGCSLQGGTCENGKCQCFQARYCDHCQYSQQMNQTLPTCVDFSLVGGGECVTNDYGCSGNGQCKTSNGRRFCNCFDGWMCANCQTSIVDFIRGINEDCPPAQTIESTQGGGSCSSDLDCGNFQGLCVDGKCVCHQDRWCPHCQVDVWNLPTLGCPAIETFGGGFCRASKDCNTPFGECKQNRCVCGVERICLNCQLSFADYLNSNGKCPSFQATVPIGGGNCTENEECNELVGGLCVNSTCQCFDGWGCSYCTEALATMEGFDCPEEDSLSVGLSSTSIAILVVVFLGWCFVY